MTHATFYCLLPGWRFASAPAHWPRQRLYAVSAWRQALGPTDSNLARQQAPSSIRARWGTDKTYNCCHGSDSPTNALAELSFFFSGQPGLGGGASYGRVQPVLEGTSLCLIKPQTVREGHPGSIMAAIQQHGFTITAAESFYLERHQVRC
jgi:nucleoside-diphosphate kinase